MHQDKQATLNFIRSNNLIGIRAGKERENFLDIWMVVIDDRIFARSWGLSERSWFDTFKKDSSGAIRCAGQIIPVTAVVPSDIDSLNEKISQAYLKKYNSGSNAPYALGIIEARHVAKTMEFVI